MNLDENINMFLQVAPLLLPPDGRSARKFSVFCVRQKKVNNPVVALWLHSLCDCKLSYIAFAGTKLAILHR